MFEVIHVAGNLLSSQVHKEIIDRYDLITGHKSLVIVPVKSCDRGKKKELSCWRQDIVFIDIPNILRFFPLTKVLFTFLKISCLHRDKIRDSNKWFGHSIWTDGSLCWLWSFFLNTKYFLFLRNTDVNVFFNIPWVKWFVNKIVFRSVKIFVPTKTYMEKAIVKFEKKQYKEKFTVLPNGIDDFWHDNICELKTSRKDLVYVGKADKNKNLINTFLSIEKNKNKLNFETFHIVGISAEEFRHITNLVAIPHWIMIHGFLKKQQLIDVYRRSSVLILPSYVETFGLIYIEAMSQGCSVICSQGQGISLDFVDQKMLKVVDPKDIQDIFLKLQELLITKPTFDALLTTRSFRWNEIVESLIIQSHSESEYQNL